MSKKVFLRADPDCPMCEGAAPVVVAGIVQPCEACNPDPGEGPHRRDAVERLAELRALLVEALGPMPHDWPHYLGALRRKLGMVDDFDAIRRERDRALKALKEERERVAEWKLRLEERDRAVEALGKAVEVISEGDDG